MTLNNDPSVRYIQTNTIIQCSETYNPLIKLVIIPNLIYSILYLLCFLKLRNFSEIYDSCSKVEEKQKK